jgi:AraC-like DNA-binding protein
VLPVEVFSMSHVRWTHLVETDATTIVFPDGCRDLLLITAPGGRRQLMLTDWDGVPRTVSLTAGTAFTGFRFRPGTLIDPAEPGLLAGCEDDLERFVAGMILPDPELDQIVDALALSTDHGMDVARLAGVSQRTLQRHFRERHLPPPDFWRLLGRARRAALLLTGPLPLVDIACGLGFSDQAHMTRELVRWFGRTPSRLRRDPAVLLSLCQPGLGNWTGEHISIKKPLGSLT